MAAYRKEYLPGYTGFVPQKKNVFGCTAGDTNRLLTNRMVKPSLVDIENSTKTQVLTGRDFFAKTPNQG
jgi:hypothetical protein